jgi:guanine deaminase
MNRYMKKALKEATRGVRREEGGPFGCVIVKNGKIVASTHNTVHKDNDATCHAEMNAIREVSKKIKNFDLSDCEVYTTGKPCPMCKAALNWAKVKSVYYGCSYADARAVGFDEENANNQGYTETQIDKDECWQMMKDADFKVY